MGGRGEDDRGLAVTARLSENWLIEPVRDAIAAGAVSGMSFRFTVVDEEWDPPVTVGVRLVSVLDDCVQHAGQAGYARGLLFFNH